MFKHVGHCIGTGTVFRLVPVFVGLVQFSILLHCPLLLGPLCTACMLFGLALFLIYLSLLFANQKKGKLVAI